MTVRVRLFAALRDAAGTGETTVVAHRLPALLDELRSRYGEPFTTRLRQASVLVDGQATERGADVALREGVEVVLLPPFSGGC